SAIVTDPIGFIGNIITAVKKGIGLFQKNINKHLVGGLISWLTGAMADVPIQLPAKFDLKGILSLVLQILGLTWERIRSKLVKRLGERVVKVTETSVDIIRRLITEGPMALWEMIKTKAGEIKNQIMEGIRNWVIFNVIKQGIIKLISFLNPAGAIVQAILAIYNTVMFFVENWQRIVDFVKSVFDSIGNIAMGKISAAATFIERAMAMTIPIIMNFLARLLGLSGIGKAVSKIIKKVRKPIDKIVDKVIDKVVKMARKMLKKGKAGVNAAANKIIAFVFPKHRFKAGEKSHQISFKGKLPKATVMVNSKPKTLTNLLNGLVAKPENSGKKSTVKNARTKLKQLDKLQSDLAKNRKLQKTATSTKLKLLRKQESSKKKEVRRKITEIAFLLVKLMVSQDIGTQAKPVLMAWPKPSSKKYPTLWFGPRSDNRIPQKDLKNRSRKKIESLIGDAAKKTEWISAGHPIIKFIPENRSSLPFGGPRIGVTPPYTIFRGKQFKLPTRPPGGTPGGGKINNSLKKYGFSPSTENMDGDHVHEIQMGGKDNIRNLWPLNAGINRSAGGKISRMIFDVKGQRIPMSVLKARARSSNSPDVWMKIKSTL
ncbi:MAG: hypothetical protein D3909_08935, partial [Candidatus Electrothrix sp. ATG1]|nr:hypothetical protein [Candidatus Electrothrix sp. ATG1]